MSRCRIGKNTTMALRPGEIPGRSAISHLTKPTSPRQPQEYHFWRRPNSQPRFFGDSGSGRAGGSDSLATTRSNVVSVA